MDALVGLGLVPILTPIVVLVHELGHGLVALRLTTGRVRVQAGREPATHRWRIGRLDVHFSFEPMRGVALGGLCLHRPLRRPLDRAAILVAGPLASMLAAVALAAVALALRTEAPPFAWGFGFAALEAAITGVRNLLPRRHTPRRGLAVVAERDGPAALRAWRAHRAGKAMPARHGTLPTSPDRPRSIPPPGRSG
jgi:Peptidase M50B-like